MNDEQTTRLEALRGSKSVLVTTTGAFSTSPVDPIDLVSIARYIETGADPYEVAPSRAAEL